MNPPDDLGMKSWADAVIGRATHTLGEKIAPTEEGWWRHAAIKLAEKSVDLTAEVARLRMVVEAARRWRMAMRVFTGEVVMTAPVSGTRAEWLRGSEQELLAALAELTDKDVTG